MPATDLKLASSPPDPPQDKALGLDLARRIERTRGLVRQARRKVKRSDSKGRKRARKQLDRFRDLLSDVEQDAISSGVTEPFAEDAARILSDGDEHLDAVISRKKRLKKRHLRRIRKQVRTVRRRFEALLSSQPAPTPTLAPDPPDGSAPSADVTPAASTNAEGGGAPTPKPTPTPAKSHGGLDGSSKAAPG